MRLLRAKIWINLSVDKNNQRRRSVSVGQADLSKIAQKKTKIYSICQLRVYLGKLMHSRSTRTFHHCLQKRFISVYTII